MSKWHPIETAPKDCEILLWYPVERKPGNSGPGLQSGGAIQGWWFESPKETDDGWETVIGFIGEPSYWMELPQKPSQSEETPQADLRPGYDRDTLYEQAKYPFTQVAYEVDKDGVGNLVTRTEKPSE